MKTIISALTIFFITFLYSSGNSQYNLEFFIKTNYWEHTDLYGASIGCGILKEMNNMNISVIFSAGYGEKNRYDDYPLFDTNILTLLTINNGNKPKDDIFFGGLRSVSDDARQLQLDISIQYNFLKKSNYNLYASLGGFVSTVSQFYIVDVLYGYELSDHFYIDGPVNLAIISHQKFITGGAMSQLGINYSFGKNHVAAFIDLGLGYRKTSYFGLGIKAGGML